MHVHLPKPLHGWRELLGEIGVIVIGVLIALAAEQAVEWTHWRHEVADTREALRAELARAVGSFNYRLARQSCADQRLNELTHWLDASRAGDRPPLARDIGGPSGYSFLFGAWDVAKAGQAAWRMPLEERLHFAHLYGALAAFSDLSTRDNEAWRGLAAFTKTEPLDHQDRVRMRGFIAGARRTGTLMAAYAPFIRPDVEKLAIVVERRPVIDPKSAQSFCQPLLVGHINSLGSPAHPL